MSEIREVKCDNCNNDLSQTGNSVDYRILLANERMPCDYRYAVTDMLIEPPLDGGSKHFCGTTCLSNWVKAEFGA